MTIRNTQVLNSTKRGIDVTAVGNVVIEQNTMSGNGSTGIVVISGDATGVAISIADNQVANSGSHGIFVDGAVQGSIERNVLDANAGSGMRIAICPKGIRELNEAREFLLKIAAQINGKD